MFKFYRDGSESRREDVTGHDRFCRQKVAVPRYRRRRATTSRRNQAEIESAFELSSIQGSEDSVATLIPLKPTVSVSESGVDGNGRAITKRDVHPIAVANSSVPFQPNVTGMVLSSTSEDVTSSLCSLTRFISSVGALLNCRHGRKTSLKYDPDADLSVDPMAWNYENLPFDETAGRIAQLEKAAGHRICMKYLETRVGRYEFIDHLPDIGRRRNRLWYLVCDSTVGTERLLTVTPCSPKATYHSVNSIMQACQALQHPYVSPILDLEIIEADVFGKQFVIVITPAVARGSLRDIYHRSQWTDSWEQKYKGRGSGLSEIQVQRLSCQILEALLEMRLKGLPSGVGVHLHPGNILIQHGTARFCALDSILFGHPPRKQAFWSENKELELESIDSMAFAFFLFTMCSGYELTSAKLGPTHWTEIQDYAQVLTVLEFILQNPNGRIPTLCEIAQLDYYRTLDLRELRAPPPSTSLISGPPISAVHYLIEYIKANHGSQKTTKSKSFCEIASKLEGSREGKSGNKLESTKFTRRTYSSSTPSIPQTVEEAGEEAVANVTSDELSSPRPISIVTSTSHSSSLLSVYCTPPNSLN